MSSTVTLSYTEQGRGIPVLLLHGYPFSSAIWRDQQQSLSDAYRVITPDLRGHGKSPIPEGVYSMEIMARDVLALLDSLSIEQAVIIGHSMGGYVTLAAWHLAPERFLAMGLIGSQAAADNAQARANRYKTADNVFLNGNGVVADEMLPRLFAAGISEDEPIVDQVRTMIGATKEAGMIGALKGMAIRPDSTTFLPTISVPVLIVAGDKDNYVPLSKAEAMAKAIPAAVLVTVESSGHLAMLEQPHATTLAIRNFLSELVKTAST